MRFALPAFVAIGSLATPARSALVSYEFEVEARFVRADFGPELQVGTRLAGSFTYETDTPGTPYPPGDTSLEWRYFGAVVSWHVQILGTGIAFSGSDGQISLGENTVSHADRIVWTMFPDSYSNVLFSNGVELRFFQIDLSDHPAVAFPDQPIGDMLINEDLPAYPIAVEDVFVPNAHLRAVGSGSAQFRVVSLNYSVVPEPSGAALLALAISIAAWARRRGPPQSHKGTRASASSS